MGRGCSYTQVGTALSVLCFLWPAVNFGLPSFAPLCSSAPQVGKLNEGVSLRLYRRLRHQHHIVFFTSSVVCPETFVAKYPETPHHIVCFYHACMPASISCFPLKHFATKVAVSFLLFEAKQFYNCASGYKQSNM